jgi:nucleotide-binding universal stress UspA family protein
MIKDVMVRLDGTAADELRLAAVATIAQTFESHVIGLFINRLPMIVPAEWDGISGLHAAQLIEEARKAGDKIESVLIERLTRLQSPVEIHRRDGFEDSAASIAAQEARAADTFVALRPNGAPQEPEQLIESVLFESGRHLFLVPDGKSGKVSFDHVLVAWNGSRESARALAEALPYLHKAQRVTIVSVVEKPLVEEEALIGRDAAQHLGHHGIDAMLHQVVGKSRDAGEILIAEARKRKADLIVMGGYGRSRLREWLLGGVTYTLMHAAPVPLLVAH